MLIRLFDVQNSVLVPTEHCFSLKFLKNIMDNYPTEYLKVYQYLFYMTCPDPDMNPFFHAPDMEKEEMILGELDATFSTEDDIIVYAKEMCEKLYETPTLRAYKGIKSMLDKIADYMMTNSIVDGRDGNGSFILRAAKDFSDIRASYKQTYLDLKEEQQSTVRGGQNLAYDDN